MTDEDTVPVDEIIDHDQDEKVRLTGERVDEILDAVSEMEVELDADPISKGPKFLLAKVAQLRDYMNEAQRYQEEVNRKKVKLRRKLRALESEYDIRYDELMVSDPDVADFRNQSQRESMVRHKLREMRTTMEGMKQRMSDFEAVEEAISNKYTHLRETGWDLNRQQKLIRDEIRVGGEYGNESEEQSYEVDESEVDFDEDEMLAAADADAARGKREDFAIDELLDDFHDAEDEDDEASSMDQDAISRSMDDLNTDVDVDAYMDADTSRNTSEAVEAEEEIDISDFDF